MRIFRNGYDVVSIGVNLAEITTLKQLAALEFSRPLVFTTGCFDLFHAGHVHFLYEANGMGARLVVGLDTDDSIRKLKGNDRPVFPFEERLSILLSNKYVDYVIEGSTDEWPEIMKTINPNVFVKGSEYKEADVELTKYAEKTKYVDMFGERHSSTIIKRLRIENGHYGPRPKKIPEGND